MRPHRAGHVWCAALAIIVLCVRGAHAGGDPDLEWWTIETAHFRVHYERNLETIALRVARLSEAIHGRLAGPLGYAPSSKTEVVLTDVTDLANGSASALPYNNVRLFVTAPGDMSPLADYDDWYLGLMTHEYTHILHVDNVSGVPSVLNAVLGKTLAPNQLQPRWIIEGLAVVTESAHTTGGRIRASMFDMLLRADVLADNVVRLDQLSSDARRWPQGTLFYLYGSRFLQWIADVYGFDVIRAVAADYGASLAPWGINRAIRRQTGRTYEELWEGFEADLRRRYARQMKAVEARGLREGRRLTHHGRDVSYPRFVPSVVRSTRYELVYHRADQDERAGIYRLDAGGRARPDEELVARTPAASPVAFAPDGGMVFASVVPFKRIYQRHDLFRLPPGEVAPRGTESVRKRLTTGLRANAPTVSPDGKRAVFVTNDRGTTTLEVAEIDGEQGLRNFRTLVPSRRFDQAFTPVFSPDGKRVAYSTWAAGGFRDVVLVDMESGTVERLTHDRAIDQNPQFSPDGKQLFFASDRTGIFNIYVLDLGTRALSQVTNVRTGAFMPAVSDDGKRLVYVGYSAEGFDLHAMDLDPERYLDAPRARVERPPGMPEPPPVAAVKHPYNPLPTLRPHRWFVEYAPGNFGSNALTLTVDAADVVGHHGVSTRMVADPSAPLPQLSLDYRYARLPFDMTIGVSNRVTPRTDFRFNDQEVRYIEKSYSLRTGISYSDVGEIVQQSLGLSVTGSVLDAELPLDRSGRLDPYASPTVEPLRSSVNVARLAYTISDVDGSFDGVGATRGMALSLGLDIADDFLGSQETIYQGTYRASVYFPMPWPGHHTLAIRSAGGLAGGSFARRGVFFVGGLNIENTSLFDALTTGIFNGAFALRGYPPSAYSGSSFMLQNLEYRIPLADVDWGPSMVPAYLRRVNGNLFLDWGGAFNKLDFESVKLFEEGALISSPDLHTSAGAELWLELVIGYGLSLNMRVGYAFGFSDERIPGGQGYFIASSAF